MVTPWSSTKTIHVASTEKTFIKHRRQSASRTGGIVHFDEKQDLSVGADFVTAGVWDIQEEKETLPQHTFGISPAKPRTAMGWVQSPPALL